MRKSFVTIVIICVSTIVSLLLALYVAPLRTTFKQYSSRLTQDGLAKVGVSYSAIENARRSSVVGQYAVKGFDVQSASNKDRKSITPRVYNNLIGFNSYTVYKVGNSYAVYRKYSSFGGVAGAAFSNTNATSLDPINPNFGITQLTRGGISPNGAIQTSQYITTTTDLSGAAIASASTKQGANGGPPPQENDPGPIPPTLPLGDGTILLLVFTAVFTVFKFKRISN